MSDASRSTATSMASLPDALNNDLSRVIALLALAKYVERARQVLDTLQAVADYDEAMRERLQRHGIRYNDPAWNDDASDGLTWLHGMVESTMHDIRDAANASASITAEAHHG